MFSCQYCEIFKNGFFYGTPSLTASMAGPNFYKLHKQRWNYYMFNSKVTKQVGNRQEELLVSYLIVSYWIHFITKGLNLLSLQRTWSVI